MTSPIISHDGQRPSPHVNIADVNAQVCPGCTTEPVVSWLKDWHNCKLCFHCHWLSSTIELAEKQRLREEMQEVLDASPETVMNLKRLRTENERCGK